MFQASSAAWTSRFALGARRPHARHLEAQCKREPICNVYETLFLLRAPFYPPRKLPCRELRLQTTSNGHTSSTGCPAFPLCSMLRRSRYLSGLPPLSRKIRRMSEYSRTVPTFLPPWYTGFRVPSTARRLASSSSQSIPSSRALSHPSANFVSSFRIFVKAQSNQTIHNLGAANLGLILVTESEKMAPQIRSLLAGSIT